MTPIAIKKLPLDDVENTMGGPHWKSLTIEELIAFIAIHLYMDLKKQTNIKTYWEKPGSIFYCLITSNIMITTKKIHLKRCLHTSRKTIFYENFVSIWTRHSKHSCHIEPFSCYIGHFLSFWTLSQKTMFSTTDIIPIQLPMNILREGLWDMIK